MERKKDLKHGTTAAYQRGCRCGYCKMAKRISHKKEKGRTSETIRAKKRKEYYERKERGLCTKCGYEKEPERGTKIVCFLCMERDTFIQRERRALHYERGFR